MVINAEKRQQLAKNGVLFKPVYLDSYYGEACGDALIANGLKREFPSRAFMIYIYIYTCLEFKKILINFFVTSQHNEE